MSSGVAGVIAITSGVFAYSAKRDYDATPLRRPAHDAAASYTRDTGLAIGAGVVAIAAAAASYWLWPRQPAPAITASIDSGGAALALSGRF